MVTVTENAQKKIEEALKEKKDAPQSVRVFLHEGGWGGPSLSLALDEPSDSDKVFENGNTKYIIDDDLLKTTGDITIDFINEGWQKGFTITSQNPVAGACCPGDTCSAKGSCS